jgi:crotonobetainyl-CoA:carnitine CoA-transferase CaiB-like acyl-CoA transferase
VTLPVGAKVEARKPWIQAYRRIGLCERWTSRVWPDERDHGRLLPIMDEPLNELVDLLGLGQPAPGQVRIEGSEPVFPCRFPLARMSAAALAACGLAVSELWELRTGRPQEVEVSLRHAGASLLSFAFLRAPGIVIRGISPTIGLYRTRNDRWIHLHGGFPHLAAGTLRILGCQEDRQAIANAVRRWDAEALEDALAQTRLCGAVVRSAGEWAAHPQGQGLAELPVVELTRLGDGPAMPLGVASRPLSGIRVLDLTRVLAGPTCGRTLAEHGADVLRVTCPRLPDVEPFVIDTGHGKLSAALDLDRVDDVERLKQLASKADVFVGGYRSGALEHRGFGPQALAALGRGIVYVSINCYGHLGPWRERAGWEQLAQSVTGLAHDHGGAETPALVPAAACDYTTGYLAAFGALVGLARRSREGGSWHVRASLSQTGMWIQRRGSDALAPGVSVSSDESIVVGRPRGFSAEEIAAFSTQSATAYGRIHHLAPALRLSETPPRWERPSAPLGTHPPVWPD